MIIVAFFIIVIIILIPIIQRFKNIFLIIAPLLNTQNNNGRNFDFLKYARKRLNERPAGEGVDERALEVRVSNLPSFFSLNFPLTRFSFLGHLASFSNYRVEQKSAGMFLHSAVNCR